MSDSSLLPCYLMHTSTDVLGRFEELNMDGVFMVLDDFKEVGHVSRWVCPQVDACIGTRHAHRYKAFT